MGRKRYFIIDFDSTIVTVESLDLLAKIVLKDHNDRDALVKKIQDITQLGMEGKLDFGESLAQRIQLFSPKKADITTLVEELKARISPSFNENIAFIKQNAAYIYIISGGFHEFIDPIAAILGISSDHVLANRFEWEGDSAVGFDRNNPLSKKGGKVVAVKGLNLNGKVIVIGDGYTDYEIRREGVADLFFAYCENVRRDSVVEKADKVINSFGSLLENSY